MQTLEESPAMAARLEAALPPAALRPALARRGAARGVLRHRDPGVPYASTLDRDTRKTFGLIPRMSRRANGGDNAHRESFWGTLKAEWRAGKPLATRRARARLCAPPQSGRSLPPSKPSPTVCGSTAPPVTSHRWTSENQTH